MGFTSQKLSLCKGIGVHLTMLCAVFSLHVSTVLAGPEGAEVVNGQVAFQQSGCNTTITASDGAIINYSSFNIGQPEIVQFIQPGSNASVLNRILSANPTTINGTLLANGRVFFVNPAGVYIGSGARINVAQLVASSLNMSNADFINGQYNFAGGAGSVINRGDISAEKVYLIGKQVANYGNIDCPGGYVVMASGGRVFLGEIGSNVVVEIDVPSLPEPAEPIEGSAILNEGTVEVGDGTILLAAAGDIYSQAISNVGTLSASSNTGNAGSVKLTAKEGTVINSGSIEAKSESGIGGTVQMLGDKVGLFDAANIDASGSAGGGTVLVGGDYQGKGDTPTASGTYISPDATIKADAAENGDGGKIIVWSDGSTRAYGNFTARGGAQSGDGGLIETSGHYLDVAGARIDAGAAQGMAGTWLLDPFDVTITAGLSAGGVFDGGNPDVWTPNATGSNVQNSQINTLLVNTNVTITTTGAGAETGTISVNAPITRSSGGLIATTLTLTPDAGAGAINVAAAISGSSTDPLNVNLAATGGVVSVTAPITTGGGTFLSTGTTFTNSAAGPIDTSSSATTGGTLTIDHTGFVTISSTLESSGGNISITGSNLTLSGPIVDSGSGNVTLKPKTATAIGVGAYVGVFSISDPELTYIHSTGTITIGDRTLASAMIVEGVGADAGNKVKNLRLATGGTINDNAAATAVTLTTGTLTLDAASTIGNTTTFNVDVAKLAVKTEANFDITNAGTLTDLSVTTNGAAAAQNLVSPGLTAYTVAETGSNSTIDAVTSTGALNFSYQNTAGNITVANSGITTIGGAVTLSAGDSMTLNAAINTGSAPVNLNFGMLGADGILDLSGAATLTAAMITATGGAGSDTIIGRNVVSTWTLNATPTYADGAATIALSGIETLQGGSDIDTFNLSSGTLLTVNGGSGNNVFNLSGTADVTTSVSGGAGDDLFNLDKVITGQVQGGTGADTLDIAGIAGAQSITLTAATATNEFSGTGVGGGFTGISNLIGKTGDTLTGIAAEAATWTATSYANTGGTSQTLTIGGIDKFVGSSVIDTFNLTSGTLLTVNGGAGNNVFNLSGTADVTTSVSGGAGDDLFNLDKVITGQVQGGTGADTLDIVGIAGAQSITLTAATATNEFSGTGVGGGFTGISSLTGKTGDTLTGMNAVSGWAISGTSGTYTNGNSLTFSGFGTLQGNTNVDTFNVTAVSSMILKGGDGSDVFDIGAALTGSVDGEAAGGKLQGSQITNVTITGPSATIGVTGTNAGVSLGFSNINTITGSGAGTLTGSNNTSTWALGATKTYTDAAGVATFGGFGTLQGGTNIDTFNVTAATTANLKGGAGDDVFNISAALTGSVDGETGTDTLQGTKIANVTLTGSTANGYSGTLATATDLSGGFSNIDVLTGTGTLTGENAASTWTLGATKTYDDLGGFPVLTFGGFGTLQGGTNIDTFNLTSGTLLTVNGGAGNDVFNISSGVTLAGAINGEAGSDTYSVATNGASVVLASSGATGFGSTTVTGATSIAGIDVLRATGDGTGTLTGQNAISTWSLAGNAAGNRTVTVGGNALDFLGFATLQGGSAADTFTLGADSTANLKGGDGVDVFALATHTLTGTIAGEAVGGSITGLADAALTAAGAITGFNGTTTLSGSFTDIGSLTGTGKLTGMDTASTWAMSGTGGTYTDTVSSNTLSYSGFGTLQGGSAIDTFTLGADSTANLKGGAGDDVFNINAALTGSVNGEAGTDTLQGTKIANVTLTGSTANGYSGTLATATDLSGGFSNIDVLTGTGTLTGENAAGTWALGATKTYDDNGGFPVLTFSGFGTLQGGTNVDTFNVTAATTADLKGGDGVDVFALATHTLTGTIAGEAAGGSITGLADAALTAAGAITGFNGTTTLSGSFTDIGSLTGTGKLTGMDTASTWAMSGTGGTYTDTVSSNTLSYSGFGTLQGGSAIDTFTLGTDSTADLKGGAGDDVFNINAAMTGSVNGETGTDTLQGTKIANVTLTGSTANGYSGTLATATDLSGGFSNIDVLTGTGTLTGENTASTWTLGATKTYDDLGGFPVLTFGGFGTLQGGTNIDTFNVTAATTADLKGGAGADVFDITATKTLTGSVDGEGDGGTLQGTAIVDATLTTAGTIGFNGTTAAVTGGFSNIDTITGTGAGTLTGANLVATWGLDGTPTYIASAKTLTFSGFGTLQGGSDVDTFNVTAATTVNLKGGAGDDVFNINAALTGSVNGEAGVNSLTGDNVANTWTITGANAGTVTGVTGGFTQIANLTGGSGADTFTGAGGSSISGALTDATGTSTLNGTITARSVNLTGDVVLGSSTALNTSAGNILFGSTIATAAYNLTLDAGPAGNITLTGALTGGGNVIVTDGAVQSYGAMTLNSLDIQDATTSVTFGGDITATTTIDVVSGGTIVQNGKITSGTNLDYDAGSTIGINDTIGVSGTVDIDSTGVTTIAAAGDITAGGAVTFGAAKAGILTTAGDITTTADNIYFTNGVTLTGPVALSMGTGTGATTTFHSTLNGTTDFAEDLRLTAGAGNIDFDGIVGDTKDLGDITIVSAADVTADAAFNAKSITQSAGLGTTTLSGNVTTTGNIDLTNTAITTGTGAILQTSNNMTLVATGTKITEVGGGAVDIVMLVNDKTLTLTQNDAIDMANFSVTNDEYTDLIANSTGSSVTSAAADEWKSTTATAVDNIVLTGNGDIKIGGSLTSTFGGVKIDSASGKVYSSGSTLGDGITITGTSNQTTSTGVDLPYDATKKAAIVIISKDDLNLGASTTLSAGGTYNTTNNDNAGVYFTGGDPIDVAIYLASTGAGTNVAVDSKVTTIGPNGAMVIDAKEKVTFGDTFKDFSAFDTTNWLEAVSRIAGIDLNQTISQQILPSADNLPGLGFPGTYILRGDSPAKVLALMTTTTKPVPLVPPIALELKDRGEIEGVDTEALLLQWGAEEFGQGNVQSYLEGAYLHSTDLRPYEALRKLKKLVEEILIDKGGQSQAALVEIVAKHVKEGSQPTEEQICLIAVELKNNEAVWQWLKAFTDYMVILNTEIGMTAEGSVKLAMEKYGPEDMRGKLFIQMCLESSIGKDGCLCPQRDENLFSDLHLLSFYTSRV